MARSLKVSLFHQNLWCAYKAVVFNELNRIASQGGGVDVSFYQIAETDSQRAAMTPVDLSYHRYPYTLLFKGRYDDIGVWRLGWAIISAIRKDRPDLLLLPGYFDPAYYPALIWARLIGIKVGTFCDSTFFDRKQSKLKYVIKWLFLKQCVVVFGYGARSAEYLQYLGVPAAKVVKRCQTAALPDNYASLNIPEMRVKNAVEQEVLYVGRLDPEKNLFSLIRAFYILLKKNQNARLRLIGSGRLDRQLKLFATMLGLGEAVIFEGSRLPAVVHSHMLSAACLVLPSVSEPWGLAVNEALSFGCPVVVSDKCGCAPELTSNSSVSICVSPDDCDQMAEAMGVFLSNYDRAAMARGALALIKPFTPDAAASQIMSGVCMVLAQS